MTNHHRVTAVLFVLCFCRAPMLWGHSHSQLSQTELASHLRDCDPLAATSQTPEGWHWHLLRPADAAEDRLTELLFTQGHQHPTASDVPSHHLSLSVAFAQYVRADKLAASEQAADRQRTYLQLNILLL